MIIEMREHNNTKCIVAIGEVKIKFIIIYIELFIKPVFIIEIKSSGSYFMTYIKGRTSRTMGSCMPHSSIMCQK